MNNTKHYPTHPGAELTPIELEWNMGKDINGVEHREPWKAYDIDEVNALLAEKNKEITELRDESAELHNRIATLLSQIRIRDERIDELKAKLESVQESMYADVVDAGMENRRLKRALWLARAKRALEKIAWFKLWNASISTMNPEDGARQEFDKWKKALGKFLAKAEQYK